MVKISLGVYLKKCKLFKKITEKVECCLKSPVVSYWWSIIEFENRMYTLALDLVCERKIDGFGYGWVLLNPVSRGSLVKSKEWKNNTIRKGRDR